VTPQNCLFTSPLINFQTCHEQKLCVVKGTATSCMADFVTHGRTHITMALPHSRVTVLRQLRKNTDWLIDINKDKPYQKWKTTVHYGCSIFLETNSSSQVFALALHLDAKYCHHQVTHRQSDQVPLHSKLTNYLQWTLRKIRQNRKDCIN